MAAGKANRGKLTYAYSTATTRLAAELFAWNSGITLTAVPYKSWVTALSEVAGGQVDKMFIDHVTAPFPPERESPCRHRVRAESH
ncbi:hypothetical protein J7E70_32900 [Variovorax paradoxus]|nr:hypothetical protein [Variovorax paradoxus]